MIAGVLSGGVYSVWDRQPPAPWSSTVSLGPFGPAPAIVRNGADARWRAYHSARIHARPLGTTVGHSEGSRANTAVRSQRLIDAAPGVGILRGKVFDGAVRRSDDTHLAEQSRSESASAMRTHIGLISELPLVRSFTAVHFESRSGRPEFLDHHVNILANIFGAKPCDDFFPRCGAACNKRGGEGRQHNPTHPKAPAR